MKNINDALNKDIKDLNYKLKISYEEAKEDDTFKQIINSINLKDEELMKYTSKIEDCAKELKNCKNCKNLSACKNALSGYCFLPELVEGKLTFTYLPCRHKRKYIEENKYFNNVTCFDIPREIKEAKMKDIYTDDKNRIEVITWISNYIKEYRKGNINKGLYLHGNFGCGKTYLLAAMFNELAKTNIKSVIVYWPEYLRSLKASFASSYHDEFDNKFKEVKYAKLLLIDDLGAESVTEWNRDEILGTILQYRMQEGLPTFITSNLNMKELSEHLSYTSNKSDKVKASRIIERVKQLTEDIEMISKNNRK